MFIVVYGLMLLINKKDSKDYYLDKILEISSKDGTLIISGWVQDNLLNLNKEITLQEYLNIDSSILMISLNKLFGK